MKIFSLRAMMVWVLAVVLGTVLLFTSQRVQEASKELRQLDRSIEAEQEALVVLNAEWEYLNAPQRLEKLAQDYFGMDVPEGKNLLTEDKALPFPAPMQNSAGDLFQKASHEAGDQKEGAL